MAGEDVTSSPSIAIKPDQDSKVRRMAEIGQIELESQGNKVLSVSQAETTRVYHGSRPQEELRTSVPVEGGVAISEGLWTDRVLFLSLAPEEIRDRADGPVVVLRSGRCQRSNGSHTPMSGGGAY